MKTALRVFLLAACAVAAALIGPAAAQIGPGSPISYLYCPTATGWAPCSASNPLEITGSFSASLGGFTPSAAGARGTPVTVTTSDSSGTLPTGTVVIVSNVGTTNPMYCNVNAVAATTSDQLIPAESWFAFTIPSGVTVLHCIATGNSTTANTLGGSGLATGAGGGSGGGGGSNPAAGATGSAVPADASYSGINIGGTLRGQTGVDPSGSVYAGQIDLTTVNGVTTLTGAGAVGTGSARIAVGQDTTTIAGSAPGTAGAASANVVTVQGVTSMTPVQVSQATPTNLNASVTGVVNVTPSDCSGTITSGASAQTIIAASASLHGFQIANLSATDTLWISFTGTASPTTAGSYPLVPLSTTSEGSYSSPFGFGDNHALSGVATTTGDKFSCTQW